MDPVRELVSAARRRILFLRSVDAALRAVSGLLAVLAVVLLAGTNLIGWQAFTVMVVAAAALASVQVWRRFPAAYQIAREVDQRCGLQDSISTAWHISAQAIDSAAAHFQRQYAAEMAGSADVRGAFPLQVRTPLITCTCCLLLVVGLAGARYLHSERLDLHPSFLALWMAPHEDSSREPAPLPHEIQRERAPQAAASPAHAANLKVPPDAAAGKSPNDPETAAAPGESSGQHGIFQRMKDAVSELMDKLKPQSGAAADASPQDASEQKGEAQKQNQSDKPGNNSSLQNSAKSQDQLAQPSSGEGQKGEQQDSRPSEAKARQGEGGLSQSEASKADGNGNSPQSGAGSENGAQHIATAAELNAMGKIEQMMGQRAAQISGDMTMVSSGGPQRLSTAFSGRDAQHGSVDSPANGDRIAPQDREFVRRYMDEMHRLTEKQEAAKQAK